MSLSPPSALFLNRVFPPDPGATGRLLTDLAGRMAALGWRVTVVADGDGPSDAPPGVAVRRAGGPGVAGAASRRAYGACLARLTAAALGLPRHDVVVTMTDPPMLALAGPVLAARFGMGGAPVRLFHWCHDLYPALLPVLGRPVPALPLWNGVMGRALRRYDGVIAIGTCMEARLRALGVPAERLTVLPNWADPALRPVVRSENPFRRRHGIPEDRFVALYSGTIGLAHPLDAVVEAARRVPAALFLVIGGGRGAAALERAMGATPPVNLRRLPLEPAERVAESLSAADLHLAALDPRAEGLMVPSKVAAALAVGRPCLFLGPAGSDAARLALAGGGTVLPPHDGAALAAAVRTRMAGAPSTPPCPALPVTADAAGRRFSALMMPERAGAAQALRWGKEPWGERHG